ncbi:cache domain-containing protein [Nitratidesulfovibrio termitidis]|uniref:cache domain-containing protein n=1 Tax=Nitratidesulfovibrio termitidis TaxID=42252 RepID=UPI000551B166|nr:cache domain-containing protein [Nitratidesulfovibrio termitidis]
MSIDVELRRYLHHMPGIGEYRSSLSSLSKWWTRVSLTGKINSLSVAATLLDSMDDAQRKFQELQERLIDSLARENTRKVALELGGMAQVAVDIVVRNLFERTADVGFLATDGVLVDFLAATARQGDAEVCVTGPSEDAGVLEDADADRNADPAQKAHADNGAAGSDMATDDACAAVRRRLRDYRDKYTVYDEILVLDTQGRVRAQLDESAPVRASSDPLVAATLAEDGYLETFRPSDLCPGKPVAHIFSHRILHPETGRPLGVLCLCFRFENEMEGIFRKLVSGRQGVVLCLTDDAGTVIASSAPGDFRVGSCLGTRAPRALTSLGSDSGEYLALSAPTNGYQGYAGLGWRGCAATPPQAAFADNGNSTCTAGGADQAQPLHPPAPNRGDGGDADAGNDTAEQSCIFSDDLLDIAATSEDVNQDLGLVVINGQIIAVKRNAQEFLPVLDEIRKIGHKTKDMFVKSIDDLYATVSSALLSDLRFKAALACDIMDRNLYERANDCRWWALTPAFRHILAQADNGRTVPPETDRRRITGILRYIHELYTVYHDLCVYNAAGVVVAVSNPANEGCVGRDLSNLDFVRQTVQSIRNQQEYRVSPFAPSDLYGGRPTYVYNAAVMHPADERATVGGIGIVFDAEPQFEAMLVDALPRDEAQAPLHGAFGLYVDAGGTVVSSTSPDIRPGHVLALPPQALTSDPTGVSCIHDMLGRRHALGAAPSCGYREYKNSGDYVNDVTGVLAVPV